MTTPEPSHSSLHPLLDSLLQSLWSAGGTDLLLVPGLQPKLRLHGELTRLQGFDPCTSDTVQDIVLPLLSPAQRASFASEYEWDFSFAWKDVARVRGAAFRQGGALSLALRVVPRKIPSMEELGLPPVLQEFTSLHQGLILVTGPTGSGKSTTIASMVDRINATRACHIITVEDPVEYVHDHKRAVVEQREVGTDTPSFPAALRAALRQDPDVLVVGEMRDLDSIRFALTLAETGHLVLATLHTNDTAQAVGRMIDVFPGDQQAQVRTQLAAALTGIVYQRLLPRQGGGLVAAYEVLRATTAARNLIKESKTHQLRNVLVTGTREGMLTLEQSLTHLVQAGIVSRDDALSRTLHPHEVSPLIGAQA